MEYLTDEDLATAEANGINRQRAKDRFYKDGWSKRRAITQKMMEKHPHLQPYKEICEKNGINFGTFRSRIRKGWTYEEASTMSTIERKNVWKRQNLKITDEHFKIAESNGIKPGSLRNRVYNLFWDVDKAVNTPIKTKHRRKSS